MENNNKKQTSIQIPLVGDFFYNLFPLKVRWNNENTENGAASNPI